MKNISRLLIILLSASFILSSCEDEDVLNFPDFTVPVILLTDNTRAAIVIQDVGTPAETGLSFTLDAENFDGAADGHKFFVGRSGVTSTLIDVTFIATYSGGGSGDVITIQASELPSQQNITLTQLASATGVSVADLNGGDSFVITYEYRIDANNSGEIKSIGTPGADYCGGFTNEGEFCTMRVDVICTQIIASPPGAYQINFNDSYGDGWNGAAIRFVEDGVARDFTLADGASGSEIVTVPAGVSTLTIEFVSGDWDSEVTFEVISPAGNVIAAGGPTPTPGTLLLNLCDE